MPLTISYRFSWALHQKHMSLGWLSIQINLVIYVTTTLNMEKYTKLQLFANFIEQGEQIYTNDDLSFYYKIDSLNIMHNTIELEESICKPLEMYFEGIVSEKQMAELNRLLMISLRNHQDFIDNKEKIVRSKLSTNASVLKI